MKKLLVILGPTATGKTDLALELAKKFNGEVVACDSRQVYKGLDIGTGKAPSGISNFHLRSKSFSSFPISNLKKGKGFWEAGGVKIWMYDVVELPKQYTVFDYVKDANEAINRAFTREKVPIVVGGTGLYLKALLEGLDNLLIPCNKDLREELEGLELIKLQEKLNLLSPVRFQRLNDSDRANKRRLIRAIEIILAKPPKKYPISNIQYPISNILKIGLSAPRPFLNHKIDNKVIEWFKEGIVQEVENLIKSGVPVHRFKELGLEYREIADNLISNKYPDEGFIQVIQTKIRQYAKRQITWFKKEPEVNWFDITIPSCVIKVEKLVGNWYNSN